MANIKKTPGKSEWTRIDRDSTTKIVRTRSGEWRVTEYAGGSHSDRPDMPPETRWLTEQEAIQILIDVMRCDEDELSRIRSLADLSVGEMAE